MAEPGITKPRWCAVLEGTEVREVFDSTEKACLGGHEACGGCWACLVAQAEHAGCKVISLTSEGAKDGELCRKGVPGCFCLVGWPPETQCEDCREPGRRRDSHCVCPPAKNAGFFDDEERVVGVAYRALGMVITLPKPARHGHVLNAMREAGLPRAAADIDNAGFLTSLGRWMNREDAYRLAKMRGQLIPRPPEDETLGGTIWPGPDLYSEDLW